MTRIMLAVVLGIALLFAGALATTGNTHAAGVAGVTGTQQGCAVRAVAGATNQAGLIVKFEDGRTLTYCIEFTEESITGLDLLRRSGLTVLTASNGGLGAAVCQIDGEGCSDPGNCFCRCQGGTCAYWAYFRAQDGTWRYSSTGAGARTIRNGDSDAWVWGSGSSSPGAAPGDCALVPIETPQPTSTPRPPTATSTSRPSRTPSPVATATRAALTAVPTSTPVPATVSTTLPPPPPMTPATPASVATSDVRGAAVTPAPTTRSSIAIPTVAVTTTASPSATHTAPAGVIRVSDEDGQRNAEAATEAGSWNWTSTVMFAGFALLLTAAGAGAFFWRNRAGN